MNLYQLEYFLAVAETLNYTKAAEKLHVSQSAISRQISLLEQELGYSLFHRNNKTTRLTQEGHVVFHGLVEAYELIGKTLQEAKEHSRGYKGELTIGCIDELNISLFLPELIRLFHETNPLTYVKLKKCNFSELRNGIIQGDIDVAFTLCFSFDYISSAESMCVVEADTYAAVSREHPLALKPRLRFEDLKDDTLVVISRDQMRLGYDHALDLCRRHGFMPKEIVEVPSFETQFLYVESGIGFCLLDSYLHAYQSRKLRFIPLHGDEAKSEISAIWRRDNGNPCLTDFIKLLREQKSD